jgi:hypothetical protein
MRLLEFEGLIEALNRFFQRNGLWKHLDRLGELLLDGHEAKLLHE